MLGTGIHRKRKISFATGLLDELCHLCSVKIIQRGFRIICRIKRLPTDILFFFQIPDKSGIYGCPQSIYIHKSFADYIPFNFLNEGTFLWVTSFLANVLDED